MNETFMLTAGLSGAAPPRTVDVAAGRVEPPENLAVPWTSTEDGPIGPSGPKSGRHSHLTEAILRQSVGMEPDAEGSDRKKTIAVEAFSTLPHGFYTDQAAEFFFCPASSDAFGGTQFARLALVLPKCICCLAAAYLSLKLYREPQVRLFKPPNRHAMRRAAEFIVDSHPRQPIDLELCLSAERKFDLWPSSAFHCILESAHGRACAQPDPVIDLTVFGCVEKNPGPWRQGRPLLTVFVEVFLMTLQLVLVVRLVIAPLATSQIALGVWAFAYFLFSASKVCWTDLATRLFILVWRVIYLGFRALWFLLMCASWITLGLFIVLFLRTQQMYALDRPDAMPWLCTWTYLYLMAREHDEADTNQILIASCLVAVLSFVLLRRASRLWRWPCYLVAAVLIADVGCSAWIRDLLREGVEPNPGPWNDTCPVLWTAPVQLPDYKQIQLERNGFIFATLGTMITLLWLRCQIPLPMQAERFIDPEALGRTAELLPYDGRGERARVIASGEVLPVYTTARTDYHVSAKRRGRVAVRRLDDTVLLLTRWLERLWPESPVYDYSKYNPGAAEPVHFPRSRRCIEIGVPFAQFRAHVRGRTKTVIVAELSVGPGARLVSDSSSTLAVQAMAYSNEKMDPFTVKMTFEEADDERSRNETPILRSGLYMEVGPLMQNDLMPVETRPARVRDTTPPAEFGTKTPEVLTHLGDHVAIGGEDHALEESKPRGVPKVHVFCQSLTGAASTGPHLDRTANITAVLKRAISVRTDGTYTPEHDAIAQRLAHAIRCRYGTVTQRWVEEIEDHFSRPNQRRNFETGTSQFYDRVRVTIEAFVKAERLALKPSKNGVVAADPRNISATPRNQVRGLLTIYGLMEAIKAFGCACSGFDLDELNARVAPIACALAKCPEDRVVSADAKRCDGKNGREIRSATDAVARILCPDWTEEAIAALHACFELRGTVGNTPRGPHDEPVSYEQLCSRASGAPDTTFGNTLLMTLVAATVAERLQVPIASMPSWFACTGDDTLWRYGAIVRTSPVLQASSPAEAVTQFKQIILESAAFWSQEFEFDEPPAHRGRDGAYMPGQFVPFVGRLFYDSDLPSSCGTPARVVGSFNTSYSNAPIADVALGKGIGRYMTDPHTYPWAFFGAAVAAIAKRNKKPLFESVLRSELPYVMRDAQLRGLDSIPFPEDVQVDPRTEALFHEDLPWATAGAFVRHCLSWRDFTDPVAFYSSCPVLGIDNGVVDLDLSRVNGEWFRQPVFLKASEATDLLNPKPAKTEVEEAGEQAKREHRSYAEAAKKIPDKFHKSMQKVARAASRPKPDTEAAEKRAKNRRANDRAPKRPRAEAGPANA